MVCRVFASELFRVSLPIAQGSPAKDDLPVCSLTLRRAAVLALAVATEAWSVLKQARLTAIIPDDVETLRLGNKDVDRSTLASLADITGRGNMSSLAKSGSALDSLDARVSDTIEWVVSTVVQGTTVTKKGPSPFGDGFEHDPICLAALREIVRLYSSVT